MLNYSKLLFLFLSLAIFGLGGCSTTSVKKELTFNALILDNKSGLTLEHVRIEARQTRAFASCGTILSGTSCSTTFRVKVYQGNTVYISWQSHGKKQVIGPLYIEPPETRQYDAPARIMISFMSEHDVSAKFIY